MSARHSYTPSVQELRALVTCGDLGSVSRSAVALSLTQSAVSRSISSLEDRLDAFNKAYEKSTGARPASSYAYPGYVLIDLWAKAAERAGSIEGAAVIAELEKMKNEPTAFGP